jgi:hypothetical protein
MMLFESFGAAVSLGRDVLVVGLDLLDFVAF